MTLSVGTDSYISVATADAYFATTFSDSAWLDLSTSQREIALKEATRKLDLLHWQGVKQVFSQALQFPRYFDCALYNGTPAEVQNACAEEALAIYQNQNNVINDYKAAGVQSVKMGNESITFETGASVVSELYSVKARSFVQKYLRKGCKIA